MRLFKNYILLLLLVMFSNYDLHATPQPDQPTQRAPIIVPPAPIGENLLLLGFVAVLFGSYTIYKTYKPIKKAS
jgi:hypothetical protein